MLAVPLSTGSLVEAVVHQGAPESFLCSIFPVPKSVLHVKTKMLPGVALCWGCSGPRFPRVPQWHRGRSGAKGGRVCLRHSGIRSKYLSEPLPWSMPVAGGHLRGRVLLAAVCPGGWAGGTGLIQPGSSLAWDSGAVAFRTWQNLRSRKAGEGGTVLFPAHTPEPSVALPLPQEPV